MGRGVAAAAAVLALAACGPGSSPGTSAGSSHGSGNGSTTPPAAAGKHASLTLTGTWTFNGDFTGHVVCFHSTDGHFEFEGQQPYLVDITIEGFRDGTFDIPDYLKAMTGQVHDPAGGPSIRVSRLQKVGDPNALSFPPGSGTITISDSGASGSAKWTSTGSGAGNITAEVHWSGCEASS